MQSNEETHFFCNKHKERHDMSFAMSNKVFFILLKRLSFVMDS